MRHKNRLWLLLKLQLVPAFRSGTRGSGRSNTGYFIVLGVAGVIMVAAATSIYMGLAYGLQGSGLLWLLPALGIMAGAVFNLVTTIYQTNGVLFAFRDYDFIMSLPFSNATIVASRLILTYLWDLLFMAVVMGPAGAVYAWAAHAGFTFWILFIPALLLAPLIPLMLGSLLGIAISLIASRFHRTNAARIILTLAFVAVWMLFVGNMDSVIENIAAFGPQITRLIGSIYIPAVWGAVGCCSPDAGSYLLYAGLSLGTFIVYCLAVGHWYRPLNSAVSANRTRSNYELGTLRSAAPFRALVRKEFRRLTGSTQYFLNTCLGQIMGVALAAVVLFSGGADIAAEMEAELGEFLDPNVLPAVAAVFFSFFVAVGCTTTVSVSLEGTSLWIVRAAPVSTKEILQAKLVLNILIAALMSILAGTLLWIALRPGLLYGVFLILTPLIFGLFSSTFGQWLNLKYARFDWTTETAVLKRSKPVTLATLLNMALVFAPLALILLAGPWVMFAADALLLVFAVALYRSNMTKGVERFEAFPA